MPFYRMPDGEQLFVREYGQDNRYWCSRDLAC